jgi:casein kinase II subunit alpha
VKYGDGSSRFKEIMLGDCGDIYRIPSDRVYSVPFTGEPDEDRPIIGAAMFRSPEANFCLRWGTATDIWSLGATVSNLMRISSADALQDAG